MMQHQILYFCIFNLSTNPKTVLPTLFYNLNTEIGYLGSNTCSEFWGGIVIYRCYFFLLEWPNSVLRELEGCGWHIHIEENHLDHRYLMLFIRYVTNILVQCWERRELMTTVTWQICLTQTGVWLLFIKPDSYLSPGCGYDGGSRPYSNWKNTRSLFRRAYSLLQVLHTSFCRPMSTSKNENWKLNNVTSDLPQTAHSVLIQTRRWEFSWKTCSQ